MPNDFQTIYLDFHGLRNDITNKFLLLTISKAFFSDQETLLTPCFQC